VFEYGSILKKKVQFREVAVADRQAGVGHCAYACECEVDGKKYPQGLGKTKKQAKTEAARIAMDSILAEGPMIDGEYHLCCL